MDPDGCFLTQHVIGAWQGDIAGEPVVIVYLDTHASRITFGKPDDAWRFYAHICEALETGEPKLITTMDAEHS